jgi:hypothetical protein
MKAEDRKAALKMNAGAARDAAELKLCNDEKARHAEAKKLLLMRSEAIRAKKPGFAEACEESMAKIGYRVRDINPKCGVYGLEFVEGWEPAAIAS